MMENETENKTLNEQMGNKLRRLRIKRGLSMRIAFLIRETYGVKLDPSYLSRIERGKVELPLRTLMALSDYYDVSPGWLLGSESEQSAGSVPEGLEYVYSSPVLVKGLRHLRDIFGEDDAKEYLLTLLEHIFSLISDKKKAGEFPLPEDALLKQAGSGIVKTEEQPRSGGDPDSRQTA